MHCPSTILANNDWLWIHLKTDGDFRNNWHIPKTHWINPLRYEIGFGGVRNSGRKFWINRKWKHHLTVANAIFWTKQAVKCRFGHHCYLNNPRCGKCGTQNVVSIDAARGNKKCTGHTVTGA